MGDPHPVTFFPAYRALACPPVAVSWLYARPHFTVAFCAHTLPCHASCTPMPQVSQQWLLSLASRPNAGGALGHSKCSAPHHLCVLIVMIHPNFSLLFSPLNQSPSTMQYPSSAMFPPQSNHQCNFSPCPLPQSPPLNQMLLWKTQSLPHDNRPNDNHIPVDTLHQKEDTNLHHMSRSLSGFTTTLTPSALEENRLSRQEVLDQFHLTLRKVPASDTRHPPENGHLPLSLPHLNLAKPPLDHPANAIPSSPCHTKAPGSLRSLLSISPLCASQWTPSWISPHH